MYIVITLIDSTIQNQSFLNGESLYLPFASIILNTRDPDFDLLILVNESHNTLTSSTWRSEKSSENA